MQSNDKLGKSGGFQLAKYRWLVILPVVVLAVVYVICKPPDEHLSTSISDEAVAQVPFIPTWAIRFTASPRIFQSGFEVEAGFDLNKNGKKEFAAFDSVLSRLTLFESSGNNEYRLVWSQQFSHLAGGRASIMVGDLDGDGFLELIAFLDTVKDSLAGRRGYAIQVWEVSPNGRLPLEPTASYDPPRDNNRMIKPSTESLVGDFDNDERDELLLLYQGGAGILMAIVSVAGELSDSLSTLKVEFIDANTGPLRAAGVGVGDMDQNGRNDIVVVTEGEKAPLRVYISDAKDSFRLVRQWRGDEFPAGYTGSSANIPIVDFNADGKMEAYLFTNGRSDGTQSKVARLWVVELGQDLFKAFDARNFTPVSKLGVTNLRGGFTADGDSDGQPDFFVAAPEAKAIYQIEYTGGKEFSVAGSSKYLGSKKINVVDSSKYTGDRKSSIADSLKYPAYTIVQDSVTAFIHPVNISAVVDLDGDNLKDFVIVGSLADAEFLPRPPAPIELTVKRIATSQVELSWKDNAPNEDSFKVYRTDTSTPIGTVGMDVRHFLDTSAPSSGTYYVVASNSAGESLPPWDSRSIPTMIETEISVSHSNGLSIGNQAGAGIGWSNFIVPGQDDVLYRGYLLIRSGSGVVYSGNLGEFTSPTNIHSRTGSITTGAGNISYQYTSSAASGSNPPVTFQVAGVGLTVNQITIQCLSGCPSTQWVLCCWEIQNTNTSAQQIKLAVHLDADAGGQNSVFDISQWDGTRKMIYQQKYGGDKSIGMALIQGTQGGYYINTFDMFNAANVLSMNNPGVVLPGAADYEMTLISDLGSINGGQSARVIFAIAAGNTLSALQGNVDAAQAFANAHLAASCLP